MRKVRSDGGGLRLEGAERGGEKAEEPGFSDKGLEAGLLINPEAGAEGAEEAGFEEKMAQGDPAPEAALGRGGGAGALDFGAGGLEKAAIVHASGTGGFTGETAEAIIHFPGKGAAGGEVTIGHGPHQGDAAAGTVPLALGFVVGGTGGQAHPAMHALLKDGVVQFCQKGRVGGHWWGREHGHPGGVFLKCYVENGLLETHGPEARAPFELVENFTGVE
jgi:hypothetical protein